MTRPADDVAAFLAERDVMCPACGYNLRGSSTNRCGECGARVQLTIARCTAIGGGAWFYIFALGWVWIATAFNLIQQVKWVWQLSVAQAYSPVRTTLGTTSMTPTLTAQHSWKSVPISDFVALGFWTVLILPSTFWLVVLLYRRASAWPDAPRRRLIGWVISLSVVYWASRTYFMIKGLIQ